MSPASIFGFSGAVVVALGVVACRPQAEVRTADVHAEVQFEPASPRVGETALRVRLRGADGQPLRASAVAVEGDMAHAGMRPVFVTLPETAAGEFQGRFTFTMAGDWILILSGRTREGGAFATQVEVPGVRAQ